MDADKKETLTSQITLNAASLDYLSIELDTELFDGADNSNKPCLVHMFSLISADLKRIANEMRGC